MNIKAKQVDPNRAAAVAKGNLSSKDKPKENNYFYYQKKQEREHKEEEDGSSSSESSEGSSRVAPAPRQRAASAAATTGASKKLSQKQAGSDVDSDQEALEAARRKTELFLFPPSEKNYKPPNKIENEKLLVYELTKKKREEEEAAAATAAEEGELRNKQSQKQSGDGDAAHTGPSSGVLTGDSATDAPAPRAASITGATNAPARKVSVSAAPNNAGTDDRTPLQKDFDRLLLLFEDDIRREEAINYKRRKSAPESSSDAPEAAAVAAAPREKLTYRVAARTFHELQDEAMQQIYEAWSEEHVDDEKATFVSTDHTAEAFTLAVQLATHTRGDANLSAMPFTLEEIATLESAGRNGRNNVAQEAQARLDRFMRAVYWIERLVRDETFVAELGNFFYTHHKAFLKHLPSSKDADHGAKTASSIVEHTHEEYNVYAAYSAKASDILWRLLASKVKHFDDDEFVEALYNTPVLPEDREGAAMSGPQNVLSFLAWRFVLSISDFESFFAWMVDYIMEEYNVDGDEDQKVVVAGARGLRALLHGKEDRKPTAEQPALEEEEELFAEKAEVNLSNSPYTATTPVPAFSGSSPPARVEGSTTSPLTDFTMKSTRLLPFRKGNKPPHYLPEDPSITQSVTSLPRDPEASASLSYPTPPASADGPRPLSVQKATAGRHLPPLKEGSLSSPDMDTNTAAATAAAAAAADEGSAKKKKKPALSTSSPGETAKAKKPAVATGSTTLSANRRGSKTSTTGSTTTTTKSATGTTTTTTTTTHAARSSAGPSTTAGARAPAAASKTNFSASAPPRRTSGVANTTGATGTGAVKPKPKYTKQ